MASLSDTHAWLTLAFTAGLGPTGCKLLLDRFRGIHEILAAPRDALLQVPIRPAVLQGIGSDQARAAADRELEMARRHGVAILNWDHPCYPALLKNIADPPLLLYVKGNPGFLRGPGLAVVGARAASDYGRRVAEYFAAQLAGKGLVIVSGMALGIDTSAHQGALAAAGRTVGVLGCGLDVIYPPQNRKLFEKMGEAGTLISEYPFGTSPDNFRFPARNRIISGISLGVLVVEAARRSGSLITACTALEQGREVFAIPGRVDSFKSEGTHRLLQEGAKLVHTAEDILEELPLAFTAPSADNQSCESTMNELAAELPPEERSLFLALDVYARSIDELIQETGLSARKVSELLLLLELKGLIETLPGQSYQKKALATGTAAPPRSGTR